MTNSNDLPAVRGTYARRSASSLAHGAPGSPRVRLGCRRTGANVAESRDCAARRSLLLAGISSEYYTRLERGNVAGVSESVIEGIAQALQLDEAERAHLVRLLHAAGTTRRPRRRARPAAGPGHGEARAGLHGRFAGVRTQRARRDPRCQRARARALRARSTPIQSSQHTRFVFLAGGRPHCGRRQGELGLPPTKSLRRRHVHRLHHAGTTVQQPRLGGLVEKITRIQPISDRFRLTS